MGKSKNGKNHLKTMQKQIKILQRYENMERSLTGELPNELKEEFKQIERQALEKYDENE